MDLPFTREQFFDLFAAYNTSLWPVAVALWLASCLAFVWLVEGRRSHAPWIGHSVRADYALPLAGTVLAFYAWNPKTPSVSVPLPSGLGR